jgi:ribonuclease BN (tRNA processing enzyme)
MNFKVLGCSGSECDRNHPCSFLVGDQTIVDMGSAASRLTLEQQSKITDIFLSHAHLDHTKDLAFFCENVFKQVVSKPVNVRSTPETLRKIREHLLNNELWPDFTQLPSKAEGILRYEALQEGKPLKVNGFEVTAVPVNHPGGCDALFFDSGKGVVLYAGDTGPTEKLWEEVKKRKAKIRGILLETSFPNRLGELAHASGHLTPELFARELAKAGDVAAPVYAYHLKAPYHEETKRELDELNDPRVHILEPGMNIEF